MIIDKLMEGIGSKFEGIKSITEGRDFGIMDKIDDMKGEILSGDVFGFDLDELDDFVYEKVFSILHEVLDQHPVPDRIVEIAERVLLEIDEKTDEIEDRIKGRMKGRLDDIWLDDTQRHRLGYFRDALSRHRRRWGHRVKIFTEGIGFVFNR